MMTPAELFADGLVATLKLEKGSTYILLFNRQYVERKVVYEAGRYLHQELGITCLILACHGDPLESLVGLEVKP